MREIKLKLYSYSELPEAAKEKVLNQRINDMIDFELEDHYKNWPQFAIAIDKAEEMQTPWFTGQYVFDYCGKDIIEGLNEDKEEIYREDGRVHF